MKKSIQLSVFIILTFAWRSSMSAQQSSESDWVVYVYSNKVSLEPPPGAFDNDNWITEEDYTLEEEDSLFTYRVAHIEREYFSSFLEDDYPIYLRELVVSIDGRFLSFFTISGRLGRGYLIHDFETGQNRFIKIDTAIADNNRDLVAINPDGTQLAFANSNHLFTVDAATGKVAYELELETASLFGRWTEDGLQFIPDCWACAYLSDHRYKVWQPTTGEITNAGSGIHHRGDYLEATGELVTLEFDPHYPYFPYPPDEFLGDIPPANVVKYYPADGSDPTVIFFDDELIMTGYDRPVWGIDGSGILFNDDRVLLRDGSLHIISQVYGSIIGTPTGWVITGGYQGGYLLELNADGTIGGNRNVEYENTDLIASFSEKIIYYPVLGTTAQSGFFTPSASAQAVYNPEGYSPTDFLMDEHGNFACPDSPPSRLLDVPQAVILQQLYTSTYEPKAGLDSQVQLTDMTPGTLLTLLEGPYCGNTRWLVEIDGEEVWVDETQTGQYLLAPYDPETMPEPAAQAFTCSGGLPTRLDVGMEGIVLPGDPNLIYANGAFDERSGYLLAGENFHIVDGPYCQGESIHWFIESERISGWTSEGNSTDYWLAPISFQATSTYVTKVDWSQSPVTCPDFLPSRLRVGAQGRVLPGEPNTLRGEPNAGDIVDNIPGGEPFMVIDGPVCQNRAAYWKVEYEGKIGWTGEGQDTTYWVEPIYPEGVIPPTAQPTAQPPTIALATATVSNFTATPTICPGFMLSRLQIGQQGQVLPGEPNILLAEPKSGSQRLGLIPGEGIFSVIAGPHCADNRAYWQVSYEGMNGWTAEGEGSTYWLEPKP